jgi:NAD(P)-dependent dehydrogenase (short-subunit alcohol dehydrogenase family)
MATPLIERRPVDVHQSPPLDLSIPYDLAWVKGRTVLITGGASGFGAAFVRKWAENGANIIFGDVSTEQGDQLAREVQKETGNKNVHFVHCDVTDWQSQVNLFKEAVRLSPHGGIDTVVANAGIAKGDSSPLSCSSSRSR